MKKSILLTVISVTFTLCSYSQKTTLEIKMHKGAYYDVFAYKNNDTINITNFKPWIEIQGLKINKDSSLFFFRYKEKGKAYRLVTYNLKTLEKIAESVPGYGGMFEWNSKDYIVHSWGCGTNCANLKIYDKQLTEQFFTLSSGGFIFLCNYDYVVQVGFHEKRLWFISLSSFESSKAYIYASPKENSLIEYKSFIITDQSFLYTRKNGKQIQVPLSGEQYIWRSYEDIGKMIDTPDR